MVEDEPIVRLLLHDVLVRDGYRVLEAADGSAAIETFRAASEEIDLVLLDLTLPDMDGRLALQEFKDIDEEVQVIVVSGNLDVGDVEGAIGYIPKPFRLGLLREAVQQAVGR